MCDSKSVLIVDDSRVSRMMIRAIVTDTHPGWRLTEAGSSDEALSVQDGCDFDLVILDYNMPGMDGVTLGGKLKVLHPDAHIYLLTANIQDSVQRRAQQNGLQFVRKPITEDRIQGILNSLES